MKTQVIPLVNRRRSVFSSTNTPRIRPLTVGGWCENQLPDSWQHDARLSFLIPDSMMRESASWFLTAWCDNQLSDSWQHDARISFLIPDSMMRESASWFLTAWCENQPPDSWQHDTRINFLIPPPDSWEPWCENQLPDSWQHDARISFLIPDNMMRESASWFLTAWCENQLPDSWQHDEFRAYHLVQDQNRWLGWKIKTRLTKISKCYKLSFSTIKPGNQVKSEMQWFKLDCPRKHSKQHCYSIGD